MQLSIGTLYTFTWSDGSFENYKIKSHLVGDWYEVTKGSISRTTVWLNISQARLIQ